MHAISSYRGNRPTHTQTHREDRLQYTAPLSLVRSVIKDQLKTSLSGTTDHIYQQLLLETLTSIKLQLLDKLST